VAICTADYRKPTLSSLEHSNALSLVDLIVTCDDGLPPKPDARLADIVSTRLAVPNHKVGTVCVCVCVCVCMLPEYSLVSLSSDPLAQCVMVGDTVVDMKFGRHGKFRLSLGVTSGSGSHDELKEHADHVLPDVSHVLRLLREETQPRSLRA
jgi:phosphoglycolate phosphatase-like HAD superfamily hydrolase